jgi:hypothetical protein
MSLFGYDKQYGQYAKQYMDPRSTINSEIYQQYKKQMLDMLAQSSMASQRQYASLGRVTPYSEASGLRAQGYEGLGKTFADVLNQNQQLALEYNKMHQQERANWRQGIGSLIGTGMGTIGMLGMGGQLGFLGKLFGGKSNPVTGGFSGIAGSSPTPAGIGASSVPYGYSSPQIGPRNWWERTSQNWGGF